METSVGCSHRVFRAGWINLLVPVTVTAHYLVKCISIVISCSHWYYNTDLFASLNESFCLLSSKRQSHNFLAKRSPFDFLKSIFYGLENHVQPFSVFKKDHQLAPLGRGSGSPFPSWPRRTNRCQEKKLVCESSLWKTSAKLSRAGCCKWTLVYGKGPEKVNAKSW